MSRSQTTAQQILCLLLCLSTWRGPVPMLHHHDAFQDSTQRERHEHQFHDEDCCQYSGLHWHFGNPKDVTGREMLPGEDDQIPVDTASFASSSIVLTQVMPCSAILSLSDGMSSIIEPAGILHRDPKTVKSLKSPYTFLASLLVDAPLVAVTGVCLV